MFYIIIYGHIAAIRYLCFLLSVFLFRAGHNKMEIMSQLLQLFSLDFNPADLKSTWRCI